MNLAIIIDHDPDLINGASLQSRQFIDWLVRNGHSVDLIFPSRGGRPRSRRPGVRCHPIPSLTVARYREYCVPLPLLRAELLLAPPDVDLVHAETINPTLLLLGYWIRRRRRVPMFNVLTAHIPFYYPILFPSEKRLTGPLLRIGKGLADRMSNRIEGTFVLSPG
ncbi:MAG TPA: glycosyltransferase, partial [Candidatus Bathyarchaeia archaeon]|nr:glycosyltransferase [Candidatus Bathyarchaeia archaeon]